MKKKLLTLLFVSVGLLSVAQARFYLGVEGAYTRQGYPVLQEKGKGIEFRTVGAGNLKDLVKDGSGGYSIGLVLGSETFWGKYFGMRWGVGVGYANTKLEEKNGGVVQKTLIESLSSDVSLDAMINFISMSNFSFGVFGGVGAEYQYVLNNSEKPKKHALDFIGRVGVSTLLYEHHRVDLFAKLPFMSLSSKFTPGDKNTFLYKMSKVSFGASYKIVF